MSGKRTGSARGYSGRDRGLGWLGPGVWSVLLLMGALLPTFAAAAASWPVPPAFEQGVKALDKHDLAVVAKAADRLERTPRTRVLAEYLDYRRLDQSLATPSDQLPDRALKNVARFLNQHPTFRFSANLKVDYMKVLARLEDWSGFFAAADKKPGYGSGTVMTCLTLQGRIARDQMTRARVQQAKAIWVRGTSQPDACDPVFAWLDQHDQLDRALYQQRIRAAIIAGQTGLASYLVRRGPKGLKHYMEAWLVARTTPAQMLKQAMARKPHGSLSADERARLKQAMVWLSRQDPQEAHQLLAHIPASWHWSAASRHALARKIALKAAYTRMDQAYDWLMALPASVQDKEVLTWTVRAALRQLDWSKVKRAIDRMPDALANDSEWRYWLARADEALGEGLAAQKRFRALASKPNYYGFLAADRLGIQYAWPTKSSGSGKARPVVHTSDLSDLKSMPEVRLAFTLHAARQYTDARRAFMAALKQVSSQQLPALATLAERSGWHDRVAVVVARMDKHYSPAWFSARYPMPWRGLVDHSAHSEQVGADWLYSVVRRESLFMADIGSHAGAQGLMQLMPSTARWINRRADLGLHSIDLHNPATSIRLGAAYLRYLEDRFPQQRPVAIAAYNAGPGRVRHWLPQQPLPGDVWVDTILYDETRAYTRAVLAGSVIYSWREGEDTRLSSLLPTIGAPNLASNDSDSGGD